MQESLRKERRGGATAATRTADPVRVELELAANEAEQPLSKGSPCSNMLY